MNLSLPYFSFFRFLLLTSMVVWEAIKNLTIVCQSIKAFAKPEKPLPSAFDLARQLITDSSDQQVSFNQYYD